MATSTASIAVQPITRLFTAADLAAFPAHLPSGDVDYELDKGRLILMVPPGYDHARAQVRLGSALLVQGEERGHGEAFTEIGVVLSRKPDTVLVPDAAFVVASRLPARRSPEGYLETVPDLVVEVRSKNDTAAEVERKVTIYLQGGVRVVWVADPIAKTIAAYRADSQPSIYRESDTVSVDDIIPGLHLVVAKILGK